MLLNRNREEGKDGMPFSLFPPFTNQLCLETQPTGASFLKASSRRYLRRWKGKSRHRWHGEPQGVEGQGSQLENGPPAKQYFG